MYKTRKDGRVFNSKKRQNSGDIIIKDDKISETVRLHRELEKEKQRLQRIRQQKLQREKVLEKEKAVRESNARIRKELSILHALNTNRISPEKVDSVRHGSKDHMGSQFSAIPGLVG